MKHFGLTFSAFLRRAALWSMEVLQAEDVQRINTDRVIMQERLDREDHAHVKRSLNEVGFHSAVALLSTYAGQASDLREWMRDAQLNTDRNLRLQYLAGMSLNSYVGSDILAGITRYATFPEDLFTGSNVRRRIFRLAIEKAQARD